MLFVGASVTMLFFSHLRHNRLSYPNLRSMYVVWGSCVLTCLAACGNHAVSPDVRSTRSGDADAAFDDSIPHNSGPDDSVGLLRWVDVSVGGSHLCALASSGQVYCLGAREHGQAPQISESLDFDLRPTVVKGIEDVVQVTVGAEHSCALTAAGDVYCWGRNENGQIGFVSDNSDDVIIPHRVGLAQKAIALSQGGSLERHVCAILNDRSLACWGQNLNGQVGDGDWGYNHRQSSPTTVEGLGPVSAVTTGGAHTCALDVDAHLYCWGESVGGALGGDVQGGKPVAKPMLIEWNGPRITHISAGVMGTCVITEEQQAICWGANQFGQFGDSPTQTTLVPTPSFVGWEVASVDLGTAHGCIITDVGAVLCGGLNDTGAVAEESPSDVATIYPARLVNVPEAKKVSAGSTISCVIDSDEQLWCWGEGLGIKPKKIVLDW